MNKPLFKLGQVVATPGALQAMELAGQNASELLSLHVQGHWGVVSDEDKALNDQALVTGDRLLSAYVLKSDEKVWVITEADRSSTCILLPSEY